MSPRKEVDIISWILTLSESSDDQVLAYIKKITSQLDKWMLGSKISKLVVAITSKESGETVERWQFDAGDVIITEVSQT